MTSTVPRAAVIVPTRNRRESVARLLEALEKQTCGPEAFEVIVVANACSDGTVAEVDGRRDRSGFPLRVVDRPEPGASGARNAGAERTRSPILIFLDDDIEPSEGFVAAHLEAHQRCGGRHGNACVAIGYLPAALQPEADLFAVTLRGWWEAMFDGMRTPGHRFKYTNLLSGNFSIARDLFTTVGGFDPRYRCHEDYELGYRLLEAGAEFVFVEAASGVHSDRTRLERACGRKREEGHADVQLAQQYPELRTSMLMARRLTLKQTILRWLAFHAPRVGDAAAQTLMDILPLIERVGLRMSWQRVLYFVFGYWYIRGLADALPRESDLAQLLEGAWDERTAREAAALEVALDDGLDAAERVLDEKRPTAAVLQMAGATIGELPYQPGAEPLAGRHLGQHLTYVLHKEYVGALITAGRLQILPPRDRPVVPDARTSASDASAARVSTRRGAWGGAST